MEHLVQFATNHWQLCLALIFVIIAIFISEFLSQKNKGKELTTDEAIERMNHGDAIVIDIRSQELFRQGHIVGSIRHSEEEFQQKRMDKYKEKTIILVCSRGMQSAALATKLRAQAFKAPLVLAGGITAWQAANLPLVKK